MKYKIFIISLFSIGLLFTTSCSEEFLSPSPTAAVGADAYYSTDAQLETGSAQHVRWNSRCQHFG